MSGKALQLFATGESPGSSGVSPFLEANIANDFGDPDHTGGSFCFGNRNLTLLFLTLSAKGTCPNEAEHLEIELVTKKRQAHLTNIVFNKWQRKYVRSHSWDNQVLSYQATDEVVVCCSCMLM
jgi:hypothetical protein